MRRLEARSVPTLLVDMAAWWTRPPLRCVKTNAHADATPSDMPSIYAAVGRHWRLPYVSLQQASLTHRQIL